MLVKYVGENCMLVKTRYVGEKRSRENEDSDNNIEYCSGTVTETDLGFKRIAQAGVQIIYFCSIRQSEAELKASIQRL